MVVFKNGYKINRLEELIIGGQSTWSLKAFGTNQESNIDRRSIVHKLRCYLLRYLTLTLFPLYHSLFITFYILIPNIYQSDHLLITYNFKIVNQKRAHFITKQSHSRLDIIKFEHNTIIHSTKKVKNFQVSQLERDCHMEFIYFAKEK